MCVVHCRYVQLSRILKMVSIPSFEEKKQHTHGHDKSIIIFMLWEALHRRFCVCVCFSIAFYRHIGYSVTTKQTTQTIHKCGMTEKRILCVCVCFFCTSLTSLVSASQYSKWQRPKQCATMSVYIIYFHFILFLFILSIFSTLRQQLLAHRRWHFIFNSCS